MRFIMSIDTSKIIGGITYDNPNWWKNGGPVVGEDGQQNVLVEFDPPVPVYKSWYSRVPTYTVSAICCIDGDFSGYGFGVQLADGQCIVWFSDDQIFFLIEPDDFDALVSEILPEISEALMRRR